MTNDEDGRKATLQASRRLHKSSSCDTSSVRTFRALQMQPTGSTCLKVSSSNTSSPNSTICNNSNNYLLYRGSIMAVSFQSSRWATLLIYSSNSKCIATFPIRAMILLNRATATKSQETFLNIREGPSKEGTVHSRKSESEKKTTSRNLRMASPNLRRVF